MALRRAIGLCVVCVWMGAAAQAEPPRASAQLYQALSQVQDADPLALAARVARFGDGAVLELLESTNGAERLAAVRCTPWLWAPEEALGPLVELAQSRDSELAPAAMRAALAIARELEFDDLRAREVDPQSLALHVEALQAAGRTARIRADLRMLAFEAAAELRSAGVVAAPAAERPPDAGAGIERTSRAGEAH